MIWRHGRYVPHSVVLAVCALPHIALVQNMFYQDSEAVASVDKVAFAQLVEKKNELKNQVVKLRVRARFCSCAVSAAKVIALSLCSWSGGERGCVRY